MCQRVVDQSGHAVAPYAGVAVYGGDVRRRDDEIAAGGFKERRDLGGDLPKAAGEIGGLRPG